MANETKKTPWYLTPVAIIAAILLAGPFAIPLVWMSSAFKRWHKVAITAALALLTIWLFNTSANILSAALKELRELQEVMK